MTRLVTRYVPWSGGKRAVFDADSGEMISDPMPEDEAEAARLFRTGAKEHAKAKREREEWA